MATATGDDSGPAPDEAAWVHAVLAFWFDELTPEAWFGRDDAVDAAIRSRFSGLHEWLAAEARNLVPHTPREALAAVIVLDQFPRNIYRGTDRAFATDASARAIARQAITAGLDSALDVNGRLFLYLPFEHSESLADQQRSVALISALGDVELTEYAIAHERIIRRFGRFPHRNAALDRASTPEELAFLKEPGSSF